MTLPSSLPSIERASAALAAAEKEMRVRAGRANLISFTEHHNARYRAAPHHRLIADRLEAVERGEIDRLMLMVPPRHGKSELASKHFPPLCLGRNPARQFISVSATAELAADFGRDVRNIIKTPKYRSLSTPPSPRTARTPGPHDRSSAGPRGRTTGHRPEPSASRRRPRALDVQD